MKIPEYKLLPSLLFFFPIFLLASAVSKLVLREDGNALSAMLYGSMIEAAISSVIAAILFFFFFKYLGRQNRGEK